MINPRGVDVEPGYEPLLEVLVEALDQAQYGKGKERHANDRPFLDQPIMEIGRMVGPGFNIGQATKKGQEATRLPETERKVKELLGGIFSERLVRHSRNSLREHLSAILETHQPRLTLPPKTFRPSPFSTTGISPPIFGFHR